MIGQIAAPVSGVIRYDGLPIKGVYGIPGNLIPGPSALGMAEAISFSDAGGFIARDGHIRLVRLDGSTIASYVSAETSPLLSAANDLTRSVAWLPDAHSVLWWDGKALVALPIDDGSFGGKVTSVARLATATAHLLVIHETREVSSVTVSLTSVQLLSSDFLPGVQGPAFQFGSQRVWVDEQGFEVDGGNGFRHTIPFSFSPSSLASRELSAEQMSSHWVHFYSASSKDHWALHLSDNEPTVSRLPVLLSEGGK